MTFRFFWMKYRSKNEKPFSPSSLIAQIFNDQRSEKKPGDKFSGFSGITDVNRFRTKVTVRPQDEQHCVPNKKTTISFSYVDFFEVSSFAYVWRSFFFYAYVRRARYSPFVSCLAVKGRWIDFKVGVRFMGHFFNKAHYCRRLNKCGRIIEKNVLLSQGL
jgi:hypothetical protein